MPRKSKAKTKKTTQRKGRAGAAGPARSLGVITQSRPAKLDSILTPNISRFSAPDSTPADCDKLGGLNISGHGLLYWDAQTALISGDGLINGNPQEFLSPYFLTETTSTIADVFSYYRIRRLTVTFIPLLGTTIGGYVNLAVGPGDDASQVIPVTARDFLSFEHAAVGGPSMMFSLPSFKYDGPRVWPTTVGSHGMQYQLGIFARGNVFKVDGSTFPGNTLVGRFKLDYSIDFLSPKTAIGTPSLRQAEKLLSFLASCDLSDEQLARLETIVREQRPPSTPAILPPPRLLRQTAYESAVDGKAEAVAIARR